jgi:BlaI family transcriptional regulator, penicillinase repressor
MSQVPRISEAEWEVMKVVWRKAPITANEVVDALADATDWKPKTVKTLINRLVGKKALGFEKDGRTYLYSPLVNERQCVRAESQSFLMRVYGGAVKPMLVTFLEQETLTAEEVEELQRILEQKGRK